MMKKNQHTSDERIYYHKTEPSQVGINLNKNTRRSNQELLEDKIETLKGTVRSIESSHEWKVLTDPQKYPCTYQWKFHSKTAEEKIVSFGKQ